MDVNATSICQISVQTKCMICHSFSPLIVDVIELVKRYFGGIEKIEYKFILLPEL